MHNTYNILCFLISVLTLTYVLNKNKIIKYHIIFLYVINKNEKI